MVLDVPIPYVSGQYVQQYGDNGGLNQQWLFLDGRTGTPL